MAPHKLGSVRNEQRRKSFHCGPVSGGTVHLGDTYYVAEALFPDIVKMTEEYSDTITSHDVKSLADTLKIQELIFRNSVEKLLGGISSDEDLNTLAIDAEGTRWKGEALHGKITETFGEDAEVILEIASDIRKTLFHLKEKLGPPHSGDPARAKKVIKSFYYGPRNKASLEKLKAHVAEFRMLTSDAIKLSASRSNSNGSLKKLGLVRECAEALYDALRGGWRCQCDNLHPANIELDTWSTQPRDGDAAENLRFSFLFADDAERARIHHWMTAEPVSDSEEIEEGPTILHDVSNLAASPTSSETEPSQDSEDSNTRRARRITDLCQALKELGLDPPPIRRRLGSISNSGNHSFRLSTRFDQLSSLGMKQSVKLSDALGQKTTLFEMHHRHRIQLALMLAWGVLQISSTGWLEGYWTRENILLVMEPSDRLRPYVIHRFEATSRKNSTGSSHSTLTPFRPNEISTWTGNDALFALAVFLIEVCYNRPIEDLAIQEEKEQNAPTKLLTAMRLSHEVHNHLGLGYGQAVCACLHSGVKVDPTGRRLELSEIIFTEIIQPLAKAATIFG